MKSNKYLIIKILDLLTLKLFIKNFNKNNENKLIIFYLIKTKNKETKIL